MLIKLSTKKKLARVRVSSFQNDPLIKCDAWEIDHLIKCDAWGDESFGY